ncbi:TonB-dependent receptor [Colwellia sp. D2M02]|uniref:TonB-dependent receptor plug domain-containing protein n=1 Tax=Colwellia sp. D2M02 TaxID=2841562 RepID=UPI001C08F93B|nr:TonB-dependent receptor [Colwellia sp. D2M02]MBU2894126.1 TonB-dependent receptor [Colwellia sp. D2M02]
MYNNSKVAKAIRLAMMVGATSAATISAPVFAAEAAEEEKVERIQVTGSKIKRIGALSPTPVVVISSVDMQDAGISNVNDFLSQMPSAEVGLSPENSNNFIYANGLNTTDLRGLGSDRTLVLLNGRRFIPGQAGGNAVDLNNIATSFIDRIEISTGGASAVYGADAVAGVVNIITKKSFDGVEIDVAATQPNEGGGEQQFASLTFGKEFDDGGFIVNLDFADQEQMARGDKAWFMDAVESMENPNDTSNDDGIPRMIAHYDREHYGLYDESSEFFLGGQHLTFDTNGNLRPMNLGDGRLPAGGLPGSRQPWNYTGEFGDGIAYAQDEYFRTPLKRHTVNIAAHQMIAEDHELSFDMTYSQSKARGQSTSVFWRSLNIRRDNPYVKDDLAQMMDDNGASSISMRRLNREDFGDRTYEQERETVRASIGLDGQITDEWSYSAYFQHGQMNQDTSWRGEVLTENFNNALDAALFGGEIVCADRNDAGEVIGAISGCSPINLLGNNGISDDARNYISTVATAEQGHKQTSLGLSVNGDLFELPAGFVQAAFSYDWRKERAHELPGTGIRKGLIFGNSGDSYEGEIDVSEYSAEVAIPLVSDVFLVKNLTAELAYRYMDYSSTGGDSAYKLGLTWEVNDEVRFRFAKSQSVRAPNINELYSASGTQFAGRQEACSEVNIEAATIYKDNLVKNCAADGIPVGWSPSDAWVFGGSLQGRLGGNGELQNEVSEDVVIGFIYTPEFLEGFDLTLDYWKFEITDAIRFYDYENSMDNCYQSDSLDNPFCGKFTRDPNTFEVIDYYETSLNAAVEKLSGVDLESRYYLPTSFGDFNFNIVATYTEERFLNPTGNAADGRDHAGEEARPRWKARANASYQIDDFRAVLTTNYRHATVNDRNDWTPEVSNYNDIHSYTTFDINATYQVLEQVELRIGMQNIADNTPPRNPHTFTDGGYYDVIGRRVTAGVNVKF